MISLIPSVEATFFVCMPETISPITSRSRAVSVPYRSCKRRNVAALLAGRFITREGLLDCIYEVCLTSNRLGQKLSTAPDFHSLHRQRNVSMCGDKNDNRDPSAGLN